MDVPHRLGTEPFGLPFGLHPVYPALGQQLFVELLQVQRSELFQWNLSDIGTDVVVDVALVGLVGGRPDFDFGVVLEPHLHPLPHRVLSCLGNVQSLGFSNGLFQLLLDLCLTSAQHILVDGFPRIRVMPCRVSAFPASVFSLANAAFSVGSFLCHQ